MFLDYPPLFVSFKKGLYNRRNLTVIIRINIRIIIYKYI